MKQDPEYLRNQSRWWHAHTGWRLAADKAFFRALFWIGAMLGPD